LAGDAHYSAAMAQIYPEDRGQNYAMNLEWEAAAVVVAGWIRSDRFSASC